MTFMIVYFILIDQMSHKIFRKQFTLRFSHVLFKCMSSHVGMRHEVSYPRGSAALSRCAVWFNGSLINGRVH
jgi:hypothetical protein